MNDEKKQSLENIALEGASAEVVQRYGSAVKEHLFAYSGVDNENNVQLKKGLKQIYDSKVNPDYEYANLKQQAGFAAEDKYLARENAERIINKENTRVINTDLKGSGSYNEYFDHVIIDKNGNIVSGEQMKFVGNSPKECLNKLASRDYQKYFDADATITVPKDYYEEILLEADKTLDSLNNQLKYAEETGNKELQEKLEAQIKKYEKIKSSVKDSGITNKEAMEARLHPKVSTIKDITKVANKAGLEQAAYGACISGSISIVSNTVALIKGEKDASEAALSVIKDTGTGTVISYTNAFAGSVIKGSLQNSEHEALQVLSKTNFAGSIVTTTVECGKTFARYIKGDIDGVECLEELGQKGTAHLSSQLFAAIGQAAIPIPVVGGLMGALIGYTMASACYDQFLGLLKDAKLAKERRYQIQRECDEAIKLIIQYREEINQVVDNYLIDMQSTFNDAFDLAAKAIYQDDIDSFILAANTMSQKLGRKPQFSNFAEFEDMMNSEGSFKL